jgi:hypothetical protein
MLYTLYTDGSCLKSPGGPGGYAAVIFREGEMIEKLHIPSDLVVDRGASTVRGACPFTFRVHPLPSYATCQKITSTISAA